MGENQGHGELYSHPHVPVVKGWAPQDKHEHVTVCSLKATRSHVPVQQCSFPDVS